MLFQLKAKCQQDWISIFCLENIGDDTRPNKQTLLVEFFKQVVK